LITAICSSKTHKNQINLFGKALKSNSWRVLGFIDASLLELDAETWMVKLTKEEINFCYAEWDGGRKYSFNFLV